MDEDTDSVDTCDRCGEPVFNISVGIDFQNRSLSFTRNGKRVVCILCKFTVVRILHHMTEFRRQQDSAPGYIR